MPLEPSFGKNEAPPSFSRAPSTSLPKILRGLGSDDDNRSLLRIQNRILSFRRAFLDSYKWRLTTIEPPSLMNAPGAWSRARAGV